MLMMESHNRETTDFESYDHTHDHEDGHLANRPRSITNRWYYMVTIYGCLLFSVTLSISLLNYTTEFRDFERFLTVVMASSYVFTSILLMSFMIYLHKNNSKTYELAIENPNFDEPKIVYSLRGEQISNYLKLGVIVIGLCSILYSIFESNLYMAGVEKCRNLYRLVLTFSQVMFFSLQLFFIVKYNRLVMLAHIRFTKLILAQIIFTDIMTWANVSLSKISQLYNRSSYSYCKKNNYYKMSVYFIPSVAEFTIVCMAVVYEAMVRVGKISLISTIQEHHESILSLISRNIAGLIFALLSFLITVEIFSIITIIRDDLMDEDIMKIHMFEEVFLYLIGLTALFLLFKVVKQFKFSFPYYISSVDSNLLFISAFFSIIYCIQIMVSTYFIMSRDTSRSNWAVQQLILSFRAAASIIETINIIVQTFVIQDGFHRCLVSPVMKSSKPGQNIIAVLVGINFSLWLVKSLQIKKGDVFFNGSFITQSIIKDSNPLTNFFLFFTMPISILYRFHASVCLSNLFTKMYEDESERFECMLRTQGFDGQRFVSRNMLNTSKINSINARDPEFIPKASVRDLKFKRPSIIHMSKAKKRIQYSKFWKKKLGEKLHLSAN